MNATHTAKPVKAFPRESKHDDIECVLLFNLISLSLSLLEIRIATRNDLISTLLQLFKLSNYKISRQLVNSPRKSVHFCSPFVFQLFPLLFSTPLGSKIDRNQGSSEEDRRTPFDRRFPFVDVKSTFSK